MASLGASFSGSSALRSSGVKECCVNNAKRDIGLFTSGIVTTCIDGGLPADISKETDEMAPALSIDPIEQISVELGQAQVNQVQPPVTLPCPHSARSTGGVRMVDCQRTRRCCVTVHNSRR